MKIPLAPWMCLAAAITVASGCASRPAPLPVPQPQALTRTDVPPSSDAEAIYAYLASRELMQSQKPELAAQALEHVIGIDPTPELYLELGNLYWRASRFSDAILLLKQGVERYPDSTILLSTLGRTYAAQKRFDDAVTTLDEYRKKHPESLELVHEAASYRIEQRQFGDAVDRLNAIPDAKATATTHFLRGKAFFGLGLLDRAVTAYQRAMTKDPEFYDAWVELGLTYEAQKNFISAERTFAQLLDAGVESQLVVYHLVDLNLKLNNPAKALEYVQQRPDDQALTLEAANLLLSQDFFKYAEKLLTPLAKEKPIPVNALYSLALLEFEGKGNADGALRYLEAIPVTHPHHERSLVFRIHLLYQKGDLDSARTLCQTALSLFPKQAEFPVLLSEILDKQHSQTQALDVLLKAVDTWPNDITLLYRLGVLYDRMNNREQASLIMEKVIAADPEHGGALNFLGYTLAESGKELDRAEVLIQSALKVEPDNGYYIDSLAWVYFKQGKVRQAWQEIRRAVIQEPDDPAIWEHHGDIARALNMLAEARKSYSRAVELNGDNIDAVREKLKALGLRP